MFGSKRALRCQIENLEADLELAQKNLSTTEHILREHKRLYGEAKETICVHESRVKGLEQQILALTDDNTALTNTANARLSALVGLKRYLDTLFEQEERCKNTQDRLYPPKTSPQTTPPGENDPNTGR